MTENMSLALSKTMITVSILLPTVIAFFYKIYDSTNQDKIPFSYFFLAGFYILVYLFILNSRMDYYWLRASLTANLFTSALSIIYLSQMSVIEQLSPIQQLFFSKASEVLFYFNFIIIPLAIVLVATIGTHIKKA